MPTGPIDMVGFAGCVVISEPRTLKTMFLAERPMTQRLFLITEKIWVHPGYSFEVRCDKATHMTCLQTTTMENYNGDGALFVNGTEPFWLSERQYNLTKFYGVSNY